VIALFCLAAMLVVSPATLNPIQIWSAFERDVRDRKIEKTEAKALFPQIYGQLKELCQPDDFKESRRWVFPVQGYTLRDVGKGGFKPHIRYGLSPIKGYNFYDGNRHGGHPAYDIFIRDKNMDCLDDRTHKAVNVLAPVDVLVLSTHEEWHKGSLIRGGNYVWALDPIHDRIFYFAHLLKVEAQAGSVYRAGDVIGTVGRTGASAASTRSPTHLHFMVLSVKRDELVPIDYWGFLR